MAEETLGSSERIPEEIRDACTQLCQDVAMLHYKWNYYLELFSSQENADLDLSAGRLDLVLADSIVLLEGFLNKPDGKDFEFVGPELKDPKWFGDGAGIAIRPGDAKLKDAFNKALAEIRKDGTYDKIDAKYFPFSIY